MLIQAFLFLPVSSKEVFPHDPVMETVAFRKDLQLEEMVE